MSVLTCLFLAIGLLGAELLYLKLARQFRLFDVPNQRSLHQDDSTVRGGGIIIYLAVLGTVLAGYVDQPYFFLGLTIVALVSLADDLFGVSIRNRLSIQGIAVGLLLYQTGTFPDEWWSLTLLFAIGVYTLNTTNFMDGINGMTAYYGIVTMGTLWYLQPAMDSPAYGLYAPVLIALVIFCYFNARPKAICFAGDVGSISIGFIIFYGLISSIVHYHTYLPLLLLAVYGVDSGLTIVYRLGQRQNIFQAHQLHLYQWLVRERGLSHLRVATLYALIQLGINGLVIWSIDCPASYHFMLAGFVLGGLAVGYISKRWVLMDSTKKAGFEKPAFGYNKWLR